VAREEAWSWLAPLSLAARQRAVNTRVLPDLRNRDQMPHQVAEDA
jgi:hypothetical protein